MKILIFISHSALWPGTSERSYEHIRTYGTHYQMFHYFQGLLAETLQVCHISKVRLWILIELCMQPRKPKQDGKIQRYPRFSACLQAVLRSFQHSEATLWSKERVASFKELLDLLWLKLSGKGYQITIPYTLNHYDIISKKDNYHYNTAQLLYASFGFHPLFWTIWHHFCLRQCNML